MQCPKSLGAQQPGRRALLSVSLLGDFLTECTEGSRYECKASTECGRNYEVEDKQHEGHTMVHNNILLRFLLDKVLRAEFDKQLECYRESVVLQSLLQIAAVVSQF
jgi:hypothetical protein